MTKKNDSLKKHLSFINQWYYNCEEFSVELLHALKRCVIYVYEIEYKEFSTRTTFGAYYHS